MPSWSAAVEREQRRLQVYRGTVVTLAPSANHSPPADLRHPPPSVAMTLSFLVILVSSGALVVYVFDGCKFSRDGYEGCCAQVVRGLTVCPAPTVGPTLQCCSVAAGSTCAIAGAAGLCEDPRTQSATSAMAMAITGILVSYLILCMAWPLYVYTRQEAIHPLFMRIANTETDGIQPNELQNLVRDVCASASDGIVGILPSNIRLTVDRTTHEALHEPLRVVLPALLWVWLSPQGQAFIDGWIAKGTKLGKRTTGRILFLSAALDRTDLLRSLYTARLVDASINVLNSGCEINFADLDPVPWRLFVQAILTAGIVNILAPFGSLNSAPDQYPQRMPPPLIVATVLGHTNIVVALLEMRANPSVIFVNGMTPLHYAAKFGFGEIAKMLIFSGASVDARSTNGSTPMELATTPDVQMIMKAAVAAKRKVDQAALDTALSPIESEALLLFGEMRLTERSNADNLKGSFRNQTVSVHARAAPSEQHKTILTEAATLRGVSHPNVIALYGVALGPQDKRLYFLHEVIDGDTLLEYIRQRARRSQPLALQVKRQIALNICEGMSVLHAAGLIHRRLAARNIIVLRQSIPGSAVVPKIVNLSVFGDHTTVDIPWSAPEVLKESPQFVSASDVWSFGVLYWELLTDGLVPFGAAKPEDVRERVLSGETLSRIPNIPSDDTMIMMDCWQTDIDTRPTFKQLRRRLEQLAVAQSIPRLSSARDIKPRVASSAPAETTPLLMQRRNSATSLED